MVLLVQLVLILTGLSFLGAVSFLVFGRDETVAGVRAFYRELKQIVGTVARRGWRPLLPWIFIFVAGGIGARVVMGLPLSIDVVQLVGVLGPLCVPTMLAQWTRSVETRSGVANSDGGLVNNAALS